MVTLKRHGEAMEKINALISVRERNCAELHMRLKKAGFSEEETDEAIEAALRCDLVSDERYVRSFIRGKTHSGWGRSKIVGRLRRDGIDDEIIGICEDEFSSPEDEFAHALHELERRTTHSSNPYASMVRRLVGKGYSYDIATNAARSYINEHSNKSL